MFLIPKQLLSSYNHALVPSYPTKKTVMSPENTYHILSELWETALSSSNLFIHYMPRFGYYSVPGKVCISEGALYSITKKLQFQWVKSHCPQGSPFSPGQQSTLCLESLKPIEQSRAGDAWLNKGLPESPSSSAVRVWSVPLLGSDESRLYLSSQPHRLIASEIRILLETEIKAECSHTV